ncbi:MAG: hypothetical protein KGO05_04555 [Chloroflexota bacterium]|nr:hypothetical protein [Chloroflexota bacterium]
MAVPAMPTSADRSLNGGLLLLARTLWIALAAIQLLSFASTVPGYFSLADHPCASNCALTLQERHILSGAGIAPQSYVLTLLALKALSVLVAAIMATLLFVRRSRAWLALVAAYVILIIPPSTALDLGPAVTTSAQMTAFRLPLVADIALGSIQSAAILGLFLLFPSGRFIPRWTWLLLVGFLIYQETYAVWAATQNALALGWIVFFVAVTVNIAYRYRRVSSPLERQQTKWVIAGFVVFMSVSLAFWLPPFTPLGATIYTPMSHIVYTLCLMIMPLTFFIAIQRYRLYDIDVLIRRTLIYGAVSVILAATYAIVVSGAQFLLLRVGGQRGSASQLTIVVTTLLIAALFLPLRQRIQRLVDRRFYRRHYDAERTLARFGASLRNYVDLDQITAELAEVVDDTMQPAHVSLWLRGNTPIS